MKSLKKTQSNFLLATAFFALVACSSGPKVQDYPITANANEEISKLESDLNSAHNNQVNVLSPKNFKEAQEALKDAKKKAAKGKGPQDTLKEVALGRAYLDRANAAASVARENIEDVVAAREAALNAGVTNYFSREFSAADNDLKDVSEDIEKNSLQSAQKERKKLQEKYLDLELMAIKEKNLRESRTIIEAARAENAKKYAPRTLSIAEKTYDDTEAYITANRHDAEGIASRVQKSKEAALHALNINRTAKGSEKVSTEEMALAIESERLKVAEKERQLETVEDELSVTQSALEGSADTQEALITEQEKLKMEQEKLMAEVELNKKYEAARKEFASNEAEVYKQGDSLLIRLKGLEFPSSKAVIRPKNKSLLSKVNKIIEDFGPSNVTVEGHTDSLGKKALNDDLSQSRAEAVKNYLLSNDGGLAPDTTKVEAVGLGDQKPLATNKTPEGRAQNRRVDIVITPEATKL